MSATEIWSLSFLYSFLCVLIPICSFAMLCRFFYLTQKNHLNLSIQLKIHLIAWLISLIFGVAFFGHTILEAVLPAPFALTTPLAYELIVGSLHVASANTIPISTSFLLLDRIRAISFVTTNVAKWRLGSTHVSTSVIFVAFLINFTVLVWRTLIAPVRTSPTCTFSCRMNDSIKDLLGLKVVVSIWNVAIGLYFVYLYLRYSKRLTYRQEKKLNYTVLLVFISEVFCTIIPTITYLSYRDLYRGIKISAMITVGHNLDGLMTSIVYWYTKSRKSVITKLVIMKSIMKNQPTLTTSKY